jgi:hypothetical protein
VTRGGLSGDVGGGRETDIAALLRLSRACNVIGLSLLFKRAVLQPSRSEEDDGYVDKTAPLELLRRSLAFATLVCKCEHDIILARKLVARAGVCIFL